MAEKASIIENQAAENELYLADQDIIDVSEAIISQDVDTVHGVLNDLTPADTAELIAKVDEQARQEILGSYNRVLDPAVFSEMEPEIRIAALEAMPASEVASIIAALESDDALDIIEELDREFQKEIIHNLSAKTRAALEEGLSFPEESAGRLMQREVVAVPQFWTVGKVIDYLREASENLPDDFFDIFVIDPAYHVVGHVPLSRLIRSKRKEKLEDLSLDETITIPALADQEAVAHIFRRENLASAPVVDEEGRLIGVITIDDIVDVIDEEAGEDILKLAGVDQGDLYRAAFATTGTRFRWLFVNLLTAIAASMVIALFDATIEQMVALAILMPIVASMGGNAGTQALTVVVRALATRELSAANSWRIIWKEALVGSLNGLAFATLMGTLAALWFHNIVLGIVLAAAMLINLIIAGLFGAGIPILLNKYGSDPAVSSSVFLTTMTDIIGFFAFLGLAAAFLL